MRLSIEITQEQHQQLKAAAALQGKTIKTYVLERTLPNTDEKAALNELEAFLKPRIDAAASGSRTDQSVEAIFEQVQREAP